MWKCPISWETIDGPSSLLKCVQSVILVCHGVFHAKQTRCALCSEPIILGNELPSAQLATEPCSEKSVQSESHVRLRYICHGRVLRQLIDVTHSISCMLVRPAGCIVLSSAYIMLAFEHQHCRTVPISCNHDHRHPHHHPSSFRPSSAFAPLQQGTTLHLRLCKQHNNKQAVCSVSWC